MIFFVNNFFFTAVQRAIVARGSQAPLRAGSQGLTTRKKWEGGMCAFTASVAHSLFPSRDPQEVFVIGEHYESCRCVLENIITLLFNNPTSHVSEISLAMATKFWLTSSSTEANNGSIQILPIFW